MTMTVEVLEALSTAKKEIDEYLDNPDFTLPEKFDKLRGTLVETTQALEALQEIREFLKEKIGIMGADLQRIELERLTDD